MQHIQRNETVVRTTIISLEFTTPSYKLVDYYNHEILLIKQNYFFCFTLKSLRKRIKHGYLPLMKKG